jgi:hypothetical protein
MLEIKQIPPRITRQEVDCGVAEITEYLDSEGKVIRRDTNIIVDYEKLPKMGAKTQWP